MDHPNGPVLGSITGLKAVPPLIEGYPFQTEPNNAMSIYYSQDCFYLHLPENAGGFPH